MSTFNLKVNNYFQFKSKVFRYVQSSTIRYNHSVPSVELNLTKVLSRLYISSSLGFLCTQSIIWLLQADLLGKYQKIYNNHSPFLSTLKVLRHTEVLKSQCTEISFCFLSNTYRSIKGLGAILNLENAIFYTSFYLNVWNR